MPSVAVEISRFVDEHQPGFVECVLEDAFAQRHIFVEKAPVVSTKDLWSDSLYPQMGEIACEIESEWKDDNGRYLVKINTDRPWNIESSEGKTDFVVLSFQVRRQ